jgi:hypothetical protein
MVIVAPCNVSRTIVLEDGSEVKHDLDGSYVAVAQAARFCSFASAADNLLRKQITGFDTDDFQTYSKSERGLLASGGVSVATLDGGKITLTDPVTTEQAGGALVAFGDPSCSGQKDGVTRAIELVLDTNLVGVVPEDLAEFILTIKSFIGITLVSLIQAGEIAPFRTASGAARDISYPQDIQVYQSATNPKNFSFRYWYNLKYPSSRFMGEFSVDAPFFSAAT